MNKRNLLLFFTAVVLFSCSSGEKAEEEKKETKELNCTDFKTGRFQGEGQFKDIFIERNDSMQFEYTPYGDTKLRVNWVSDCEYELTVLKPLNDTMVNKIGKKYTVKITDIKGDIYSYECSSKESDFVSKGAYKKITGK